jgi:hypothetical protein
VNILASLIRTYVPIIVGQVVAWLALANIQLDDAAQAGLSTFLGGLITAVYYTLVRLLEEKFPQFGWLIGLAKSPDSYSKGQQKPVEGLTDTFPTDESAHVVEGATGEKQSVEAF